MRGEMPSFIIALQVSQIRPHVKVRDCQERPEELPPQLQPPAPCTKQVCWAFMSCEDHFYL